MAKKKTTRRRRSFLSKIKIGATAGLITPAAIAFSESGGINKEGFANWGQNMIGYDVTEKKFTMDRFSKGGLVTAIGAILSMLAAKSGLNRYIPFLNF